MELVGSGVVSLGRGGTRSMYSDRVFISHITSNPSMGEEKVRVKTFYCKIMDLKFGKSTVTSLFHGSLLISTSGHMSVSSSPINQCGIEHARPVTRKLQKRLVQGFGAKGARKMMNLAV